MDAAGPKDDVLIRTAMMEDLDAILTVQKSASGAAQWPHAVYAKMLAATGQRSSGHSRTIFCAVQSQLVIGFAVMAALQLGDSLECELENMAVAPDWRCLGVGGRLVQRMLDSCREQGSHRVILEVRESNVAALKLYEKIGFSVTGRRENYYRQPEEAAILMEWNLKGNPTLAC